MMSKNIKIPQIIHFCWFGRNKKNKLIRKCLSSWEQFLPEYEIVEWNEDNFDISSNSFVKNAYASKKWAFVSDYVRLFALKKYGGVYLDTDVEVFKSLNPFLGHHFFSGFENYEGELSPITTAVMGAEQNHSLIMEMLSSYESKEFTDKDAKIPNTKLFTDYLISQYQINPDSDAYQILNDDIHIYPSNYFCVPNQNSYCVHHFESSWVPKWKLIKHRIIRKCKINA